MSMLESPKRVASLSSQLVDTLREHIASGAWPVGTRIPTEHELMGQLGVGRTTVREALGALVHLGLLESRVGDGTYVRSSSELHSVLVRRARRSSREHVLELRGLLESHASVQAARLRTGDDVDRLRAAVAEVTDAMESGDVHQIIASDSRFHQAVVEVGGNPLLAEMYSDLGDAVAEVLDDTPWDARIARSHDRLHHLLVDAIASGDADAAGTHATAIVDLNTTTSSKLHEQDIPQ